MPRLSKIGAAALAAFGWTSGSAVSVSYLVVAGGGGGGTNNSAGDGGCGGGGAGGYRTGTEALNPTQSYSVVVGAGGASGAPDAAGSNGSNSVFLTTTSTGGGGGGDSQNGVKRAGDGGSGGGAGYINSAAGSGNTPSTSPSQGNNGGSYSSGDHGAGGGGATDPGSNTAGSPGAGGAGTANSISGSSVTYAGGGGGGGYNTTGALGGSGGGGQGGSNGAAGISGTANLGGGGGGGGGGSAPPTVGGAGGSGVVIISYVGAQQFGGGVVTSSGGNTIHTFNTSGTLSPLNSLTANFLVVAGGGGGGGAYGGGGGAGGLRSSVTNTGGGGSLESTLTIDTNSIYLVTVGAGGVGAQYTVSQANSGSNSAFLSITSTGGGRSGLINTAGASGGSGGGGGSASGTGAAGGSGTANQGFAGGTGAGYDGVNGYAGGGGGGAGAVGQSRTALQNTGGNGGAGVSVAITGSSVGYAGGGGGSGYTTSGGTATDGGGAGADYNVIGSSGAANRGGGGGGGGAFPDFSGSGGSGVVIISYPGTTQQMAGGTVTVAGGNVIHTFTSSGYLTPIVLVTNSLRFRSSASAYMNRTFTQSGDTQKFTQSVWCKRGTLGAFQTIGYTFFTGTYNGQMRFNSNDTLDIYVYYDGSSYTGQLSTTQVFRDPSAWYHLVLAVDTTQATAANRIKFYVNGVQVTAFGTANYPNQNQALLWNASGNTGYFINAQQGNQNFFDGYITELNYIDGQALTPNSFGTFNGLGVWQPIRYGGSYGTNGFYLPFTNTTSTTTLGYDFSPQGNNWTTNNISLTAGSTYDSMLDVPTLTSATQANYCVGNWLNQTDLDILREGNLYWKVDNERAVTGTLAMNSGKWYWEVTAGTIQNYLEIGIVGTNALFAGNNNFAPGSISTGYSYRSNATKINNNSVVSYGATFTTGDVIGVAFDADNGTLTFYKNNTSQGTAYSSIPVRDYVASGYGGSAPGTTGGYYNFGQRPFSYTPPTGFVALNAFNLPTPTIGATASTTANKYMDVLLHNGNGGSQSITGLNFAPDFWWVKSRNLSGSHCLFDQIRGANSSLFSELTLGENNNWTGQSFNSNGVTADAAYSYQTNGSGYTFVDWFWKANGAGVSNTQGTITSTVSANTTAGFSIVTYTGNGTSGATVGHGLGVAPSMYIVKTRSTTESWITYHISIGATNYLALNLTQASSAATGAWNNTAPTSTVFSLGNAGSTNGSGSTFVAYCFSAVAGYSAFGSYTGNGSTDGPFIYTGFRPAWIMTKSTTLTTGASVWVITDNRRLGYNADNYDLFANSSDAENAATRLDILSNGFKPRLTATSSNGSGQTYIYMAFAENPFKYANAR